MEANPDEAIYLQTENNNFYYFHISILMAYI